MGRSSRAGSPTPRRATAAAAAERHAIELTRKLGVALRDARQRMGITQAVAATRAGLSQATWSSLEIDRDSRYTLATWDRAAFAVGTHLESYLPRSPVADRPRDAVHLKNQELIIRMALPGGWHGLPEEQIDREALRSRFADVLLERRIRPRPAEYALMEIIDWFDDVGEPTRNWPRRLEAVERYAIARMVDKDEVPRVGGCWIVRATQRNRTLIAEHRNFFRSRFPGSGRAWLNALASPDVPMPTESALLWASVDGKRLFPAHLYSWSSRHPLSPGECVRRP